MRREKDRSVDCTRQKEGKASRRTRQVDPRAQHWPDPMHTLVTSGPPKDQKRRRNEQAGEDSDLEAHFCCKGATWFRVDHARFHDVALIQVVGVVLHRVDTVS